MRHILKPLPTDNTKVRDTKYPQKMPIFHRFAIVPAAERRAADSLYQRMQKTGMTNENAQRRQKKMEEAASW